MLEAHFEQQNLNLQAQLTEALAPGQPEEDVLGLQVDTPADQTLKLLDKIASGESVDISDILQVMEVR